MCSHSINLLNQFLLSLQLIIGKLFFSEKLIKKTADKMVSDGYLSAGYNYLIMDDCWMDTQRDINGRLQPDPRRFPSGMKALADYVRNNYFYSKN